MRRDHGEPIPRPRNPFPARWRTHSQRRWVGAPTARHPQRSAARWRTHSAAASPAPTARPRRTHSVAHPHRVYRVLAHPQRGRGVARVQPAEAVACRRDDARARTHTHTHTHSLTRARTHTQAKAHTHTNTHTNTHTQTHTQAQTRTHPCTSAGAVVVHAGATTRRIRARAHRPPLPSSSAPQHLPCPLPASQGGGPRRAHDGRASFKAPGRAGSLEMREAFRGGAMGRVRLADSWPLRAKRGEANRPLASRPESTPRPGPRSDAAHEPRIA